MSDWTWYGNAGHFIGASRCGFHLTTKVRDFLVSTIGEYRPNGEGTDMVELGFDRKYETMVFRIDGECECGCGLPTIIPSELYTRGYNTPKDANEGHLVACNEYYTDGDK